PRTLTAAVSVGGRPFVDASGLARVPRRVASAAASALATGRVHRILDETARAWLALGVDRPYPARIALGVAPGAPPSNLRLLADRLAARLSSGLLDALAANDPMLAVEASSPSLAPLVDTLRRVAPTPLPIVFLGDTGTGKEVLARAVHRASGRRGRWIAESCAALPESLLEAEMFGARRGAFTGATSDRKGRVVEAHGGTLLLDEIGELPLALQAKLLRVLQEGEVRPLGSDRSQRVDVRVLAATHRDLPALVKQGLFRGDLYFRLAGLDVRLPALAARGSDLPYLVATLLARLRGCGIGPGRHLSCRALDALSRLALPGNVRQLDNVLRRAAALSPGPVIPASALPNASARADSCGNLEAAMILLALERSGGVKASAARRLGWSRQKLYRRLRALGLGA
ncbi:MAG: sigma-54-dependent Fis family transcriptional regulator, partial [Acidobacteriota bacterium]